MEGRTMSGSDYSTEFIERLKRRDGVAWYELLQAEHKRLYDFIIRRVGPERDAGDIAIEVVEEALEGITRFRGDSRLDTWLLAIARRKIAREFDRPRRRDD